MTFLEHFELVQKIPNHNFDHQSNEKLVFELKTEAVFEKLLMNFLMTEFIQTFSINFYRAVCAFFENY